MIKLFCFYLCLTYSVLTAQVVNTARWNHSINVTLEPALASRIENGVFGIDTLDFYGSLNWKAIRVDAEYAHQWEQESKFATVSIDEQYGSLFQLYFQYGIAKDLEAYSSENSVSNIPLDANEFDINFPYESWVKLSGEIADLKVGRQYFSFGPSEKRGVAFSGAPYHDALLAHFIFPIAQYTFAYISVNPYLGGTPVNGIYPAGSEEAIQRMDNRVANQHRSYSAPYKTIGVHRLDVTAGPVTIGLMEQLIIGGKMADVRDLNPFVLWHQNYGDGFSNSITSIDLAFTNVLIGKIYAELSLDDIQYGETEGDGNPTVLAALLGWKKRYSVAQGTLDVLLEAIYTDPLYGNSGVPLLKHTNRGVYRSNFRDRAEPSFVDTYVVDYPVGYYRGPDKGDLWLSIDYTRGEYNVGVQEGYLISGEHTLQSDFYGANGPKWALTGSTTQEIRSQIYINTPLVEKISGHLTMLYRYFPWEDQNNDFELSFGIKRTFILVD